MASVSRKSPGINGSKQCPVIGFTEKNSVPIVGIREGIVPHCGCQWEKQCPNVGVMKYASLLIFVRGIVPKGVNKGKLRAASSPEPQF